MRVYYLADRYGRWYAGVKDGRMTFTEDIKNAHEFKSGARANETAKRKSGMVVVSLLKEARG